MTEPISDETEAKAQLLGLTGIQLCALIKPLFMLLHRHERVSITIERQGTQAKVDIR